MSYESYIPQGSEYTYLLHSELISSRPTLLFIHGLGDSHLSCQNYLNSSLNKNYNILIPDLLGYGKSSTATNYSFSHQSAALELLIHKLQFEELSTDSPIILIAHSMGDIPATILCQSSIKSSIKGFINVEGSITQFGSFIATHMMNALQNESFSQWYQEFKHTNIYEGLAMQYPVIRPYYAGLELSDPKAFQDNATEMYQLSHALTGQFTHVIGKQYSELLIPKIYCYGDSLAKENIIFLNENKLDSQYFSCPHHFLLAQCFNEFVTFIDDYAKSVL